MPTHLYHTKHVPPRMLDIILAHALEVSVAGFSVLAGLIVGLHANDLSVFASTTPLGFLPLHLLYGMAIFFVFGGSCTLFGVLVRHNNIRIELNVEQTGWVTLAVGWGTYAWSALTYADGAAMSYLFAGAMTIGSVLRAIALFVIEKQLEAAVREGSETGSLPLAEEEPDE